MTGEGSEEGALFQAEQIWEGVLRASRRQAEMWVDTPRISPAISPSCPFFYESPLGWAYYLIPYHIPPEKAPDERSYPGCVVEGVPGVRAGLPQSPVQV